jgi:hypothetical protein
MMTPGKTTLEGAFELASAGKVTSIGEIQHILKVEGYEPSYISWAGPLLKRQLHFAHMECAARSACATKAQGFEAAGQCPIQPLRAAELN